MDPERLWKNVIEELKISLPSSVFQTFVAKTQILSIENNSVLVSCPSSYLVEINTKRHHHLFKEALDRQTKQNNQLKFIFQPLPASSSNSLNSAPLFSFQQNQATLQQNSQLHPHYTFANLVVGNSNQFAYAAAQGIINNPGLNYNPFFIWGGVGVGKTHLMQAIGHQLLKNFPQYKIKYFPAETFGNELISALKNKSIAQFKDKYRQLDCILVDDIQFIAGKEYIQEEFFHTFNALHLSGKQIVLTSDRRPDQINDLKDRLVSRFSGGLTVDIQPPDYEMRLAIIKQLSDKQGISLHHDALSYLAQNLTTNIRDIHGQLQQLIMKALSQSLTEITPQFLNQLHSSTLTFSAASSDSKITPRHLISVCAKYFDVKTSDLCGPSRKKELASARHFTAYLLLTQTKLALQEVGRLLGGRDHTSIIHARDKIQKSLSTNPHTQQTIINIQKNL